MALKSGANYESNYSLFSHRGIVRQNKLFNFGMATGPGEGKLNLNLLYSA